VQIVVLNSRHFQFTRTRGESAAIPVGPVQPTTAFDLNIGMVLSSEMRSCHSRPVARVGFSKT
jgi:hypothetical protein